MRKKTVRTNLEFARENVRAWRRIWENRPAYSKAYAKAVLQDLTNCINKGHIGVAIGRNRHLDHVLKSIFVYGVDNY